MDRARLRAILRDARDIIWRSRRRLLIGVPLLLVNRSASLVIPGTAKFLIDDVFGKHDVHMLWILATVSAAAALVGGATDYALAQILGMAAQRSITDLRKRIQQHVQRLPVRFFDATKTGVLVSRVMNDAEGIRNLVGTGLLQMFGGLVTAAVATGILFHFSAKLASIVFGAFFIFGGVLAWAFQTVRPLFKQRGEMNATISGRLTEGFSGIRSVLPADLGLIWVLHEMRQKGELPRNLVLKSSVTLPAANPATAKIFERSGVSTLNIPTDLSPAQIGAIRQSVDLPIDLYIEVPDNFGGFVRYYEMPQIIQVAAPVYFKFGLRNAPDIYPSGRHIEDLAVNMARERLHRARIAIDLLDEYAPQAKTFVTNRIGSTAKAQRDLGFRTTVELRDGIQRLIEWRNAHKQLVAERSRAV